MPSPSAIADRARVCTVPSAAQHLLRRMHIDPRLASLLGPGSESFELITREVALQRGQSVDEVRRHAEASLKYQPWPDEYDIQCRINEAVAKAFASRGAA
jgi:hypothetical protein